MRLINFKDPNGNDCTIRAVKNKRISEYEILLPMRYRMMYSGMEGGYANRQNLDILDEALDMMVGNTITIVNLDPRPIDYIIMANKSREYAIECYKYIVANCSIITITLNENKSLNEVEVSYEINRGIERRGYPHLEEIHLLHEDDKFDVDITSEKY